MERVKTRLQSSIVDPEPPVQNLVLIAVDRFGAVILPLRSPLISSKLCSFFILCTWMVAIAVNSPELFALKLVEYPGKLVCKRHWNEAFGKSSSFENYLLSYKLVFNFLSRAGCPVLSSLLQFLSLQTSSYGRIVASHTISMFSILCFPFYGKFCHKFLYL